MVIGNTKPKLKAPAPVTVHDPSVYAIKGITGTAPAIPPPTPAPTAPTVVAPPPAPIDWASVLALDPGLTAAKAAADANVKNALINFGASSLDPATLDSLKGAGFDLDQGTLAAAQANPFSTTKTLAHNLAQALNQNGQVNNHNGTLFSGATVQGAQTADFSNQAARSAATQALLSLIGGQQTAKATALSDAQARILANPELYGITTTAPAPPPTAPTANAVPAAPPPKKKTVSTNSDPLAGQKAKNRY